MTIWKSLSKDFHARITSVNGTCCLLTRNRNVIGIRRLTDDSRRVALKAIADQDPYQMSYVLHSEDEYKVDSKRYSTIYTVYGFPVDQMTLLVRVLAGYFSSNEDVKRAKVTPQVGSDSILVQFWWNPDTDPETMADIENKLGMLAEQYDLQVDQEDQMEVG